MIRTVHTPGWRRVVKLKPDPSLILPPDPLPPPPLPPPPPPPKPETAEETFGALRVLRQESAAGNLDFVAAP